MESKKQSFRLVRVFNLILELAFWLVLTKPTSTRQRFANYYRRLVDSLATLFGERKKSPEFHLRENNEV